ncbi:hypothetical protein GCM10019059_37750 [Camelimonas fluminis]|uniref:Type III secretion system (T3SS) needle YscE family protein n=1 Tax=Camelimonas fluminis TaxID=1576911 RepID=A0ABV7UP24_9HYPH|nr:hypothetical protein [Camelimonas fluminis]GHE74672.1 hypothetical protein GCM10019059_37750 [Camelimonas fluminis]
MSEGVNYAAEGYDAFKNGLGMLSSGNARANSPDRIKESLPEWMRDPNPLDRAQYFRKEALKIAQSLPEEPELANAVLDLARHIAKRIREGF